PVRTDLLLVSAMPGHDTGRAGHGPAQSPARRARDRRRVMAPAGWRQRRRPPAWGVLLVIPASVRAAGGRRRNEARAEDGAAVRAACATWFGAVEAGDVERAMPVLAPDVVFETPSGDSLVGHQGVREALGAFLETYVERITWALEIVALGADSATVRV